MANVKLDNAVLDKFKQTVNSGGDNLFTKLADKNAKAKQDVETKDGVAGTLTPEQKATAAKLLGISPKAKSGLDTPDANDVVLNPAVAKEDKKGADGLTDGERDAALKAKGSAGA